MSVPNGVWPEILFFLSFLRYSWCTEKSSCNVETLTMERLIVNHFLDNWPFHVTYERFQVLQASGKNSWKTVQRSLASNYLAVHGSSTRILLYDVTNIWMNRERQYV